VRDTLLSAYLADNMRASVLNADGSYTRLTPGGEPVDSQHPSRMIFDR
jgi:hypothetical protein